MIDIQLDHDIEQARFYLTDLKKKALVAATRQAMNKSTTALQTFMNRKVRERRKLKAGLIKRKYFKLKKATGRQLRAMKAGVSVSNKPVSLIHFVRGGKNPTSQKGVPVNRRRKVRVEVTPGRKVTLQSAFIAQGKNGNMQVFRRRHKSRYPLVKQSTPALTKLFNDAGLVRDTRSFAGWRFQKEFTTAFNFQVEKLMRSKRK